MPTQLDTVLAVEMPEGVQLQLHPAGPTKRASAWLIDSLAIGLIGIALELLLSALGRSGSALMLLLLFVLYWFYNVLFEQYGQGQTLGKRLLKLRVVHVDGTAVSWSASLLRNLIRVADFLPFGYATGLLVMACNQRFQRLGDLAADTMVVYHRREQISHHARARHSNAALDLVPSTAIAPLQPLDTAAQRAIIELSARHQELHPDRQQELAALLPWQSLSGRHVSAAEALPHAHALAIWLVGLEQPNSAATNASVNHRASAQA